MLCVREAICFVCRWSGSAIYLPTLEGLVRLRVQIYFFGVLRLGVCGLCVNDLLTPFPKALFYRIL